MRFDEWLHQYTSLSDSSIYKYSHAASTISDMMLAHGVIQKPFSEMNQIELDIAIAVTLSNADFIVKNTTGNSMYSNALKQYRAFRNDAPDVIDQALVSSIINAPNITSTERDEIIKARVGQGAFRKGILQKYNSRCVITGIDNPRLLLASHIKPWAASSNEERLSFENGLCLSPSYDKLFDIGLITFSSTGKLIISSQLSIENAAKLHIHDGTVYDLKATSDSRKFMEYHRDIIFLG